MLEDGEFTNIIKEKDYVFDKEIISLNKDIEDKKEKIQKIKETIDNASRITKKNMFDCYLIISMCATLGSIALSVLTKAGITSFTFFRNIFLSIPLPNLLLFVKFKSLKKKLWYKDYPTEEESINDLIVEKEIEEEILKKRIELDKEFTRLLQNQRYSFDIEVKTPVLDDESNGYINISSRDISKKIYSLEAEIEKNKRLLDKRVAIEYVNDKLKNMYSYSSMDERSLRKVFATITYALAPILGTIATGLLATGAVPIGLACVALGITIGQVNLKLLKNMQYSLFKKGISLNLKTDLHNLGEDYEELCDKYDENSIKEKIFELEYELMKEKLDLYHTSKKEEESLERRRKEREKQAINKETISYCEDKLESGPTLKMRL